MDTCQDCQEIYSAWLDGEASPSEIELMQAHLQSCSACTQATSELQELSRGLCQDRTDHLRLASNAMAELVLLEPVQSGLLPRPGQFLRTKLLPSLAAASWAALLLKEPELFRFWPLLAIPIFILGLNGAGKVQPISLSNAWERALAPMSWGLLNFLCLSTSALCFRENSAHAGEGIVGGLGLWEAAAAGCLLGVVQRVNQPAWSQLRPVAWLLCAVLLALSFTAPSALLAAILCVSGGGVLGAVKRGLRHTALEQEPFPFSYTPALALLDASAVAFGFLLSESQTSLLLNEDIKQLSELNTAGTLLPLALLLWWVWLRTPLASLFGLSRGRPTRFALAGFFGVLLALPATLLYSTAYRPLFQIGLPVTGLLLAYPAKQPLGQHSRRDCLRRLLTSLLVLALSLAILQLWRVRLPAEPEQARALRQQADLRPEPRGQNGYEWVSWELRNGLDASWIGPSERLNPAQHAQLRECLKRNFIHIDRCLACPEFRSPDEDLSQQVTAHKISQALGLRALTELERGNLDQGITRLLELSSWDQRLQCDGRPREWWLPDTGFSRLLCHSFNNLALNADQAQRLWDGLHCGDNFQQAAFHQLDLEYRRRRLVASKGKGQWALLRLPPAYYDHLARLDGQRYLEERRSLSHLTPEIREQLESFNLCRAALAVYLYQCKTGRPPKSLASLGLSLPDIHCQVESSFVRLSWNEKLEWTVPFGGQHE